ncbi:hypothetical protein MIR68_011330 [Amoeboaphelidium protococcarum]|nr:hypothetical protein MIR68_011330 [Amoeboaphelidium protococcarum]
MSHSTQDASFGTRAVHAGQTPDPYTGAVIPALSLSTTFKQSGPAQLAQAGYDYSRSGNPTRKAFEIAVASLEGVHEGGSGGGLAFSSGSATTTSVLHLLDAGTHLISVNDVYGGTFRYFTKVAPKNGVNVSFVDMSDPQNVKGAVKEETRMVWVETPTNPTLRLVDIKAVAEVVANVNAGRQECKKIILVVDNTFMSPYFQQPLNLGADIVVHSVTKYINGHSDAVMGVLVTRNQQLYDQLKFMQNSIGAVPSAFDCFLANRGLKTLHLRMKTHASNAQQIAEWLETKKECVERVIYPGLKSHPQHELAKRQQSGFGGMISVVLKQSSKQQTLLQTSTKFLQHLHFFTLAESLGGVESLAELPAVMTHASVSAEARQALGISDGLVRLSVGIEDVQDLINDLDGAFKAAY